MRDQSPFTPLSPDPTPGPSSRDRRYACAPFFLPLFTSPSTAPLRLRGGARGKGKSQPPGSSRRLEVPTASRVKTRSSRATPFTDLDKLKLEEQAVKSEVARLNLALRDVEGDGNCLFRALSDQIYGDQKRHPEMRKFTCDYLEAHEADLGYWASYCSFMDGEDYAGYVKRMRKSGQYASELEVIAAARWLKRDIRIIHKDHSETIPCTVDPSTAPVATPEPEAPPLAPVESQSGAVPAPATPQPPGRQRRRTRSATTCLLATPAAPPPSSPMYATALAEYLPDTREGRTMLWLALFNDAEHYQSIRRKGDRERGPAEVEDRLALPHEKDLSESARIARGEMPVPGPDKSASAKVALVQASLPTGHAFSADHITNILARAKGDVGGAVEILLEEMDGSSDMSELSDEDSDGKVEAMLLDPVEELSSQTYREAPAAIPRPARTDSPSGSSITTADQTSESDDLSHSSIATTQSVESLASRRSTRSTSGGSKGKGKVTKPYERPVAARKGKELSKELEELKMGAGAGPSKRESERRQSAAEQGERRRSQLDELKAARERQKVKA